MVVGPRMKKKREPRLKIHDVKLRSVKTGQIIATGEVIDSGKTQGKVKYSKPKNNHRFGDVWFFSFLGFRKMMWSKTPKNMSEWLEPVWKQVYREIPVDGWFILRPCWWRVLGTQCFADKMTVLDRSNSVWRKTQNRVRFVVLWISQISGDLGTLWPVAKDFLQLRFSGQSELEPF